MTKVPKGLNRILGQLQVLADDQKRAFEQVFNSFFFLHLSPELSRYILRSFRCLNGLYMNLERSRIGVVVVCHAFMMYAKFLRENTWYQGQGI